MPAVFSKAGSGVPVHMVESAGLGEWIARQPPETAAWVRASGFEAKLGSHVLLPSRDGAVAGVVVGWGDAMARRRGRFHVADTASKLPSGDYRLVPGTVEIDAREAALGWLLAGYRFDAYKSGEGPRARLIAPDGVDAARVESIAAGVYLTRDLINTPASDMGPEQLQEALFRLAAEFGADASAITGEALIHADLPMIHAVGRAADQAPRLLELRWGEPSAPKVTLVGKGVCFDTGGLNIKPGASMGLMKKDMGGAATVLGLARMIMSAGLPVRLRVLAPAVENAISAGAFRPQDVLRSRRGLTVEVNNTDAEGRLVLADALALADEEEPDLLLCMATLTGAARAALGPDLAPFYCDDEELASDLEDASREVADPLWRMPFWAPYEAMIEPDIADLDNAPKGGFAGSVTAALFLRRFVTDARRFAHFDIYGWVPKALPGRPRGGEAQASRAVFDVLCRRYGA
ncbi:MAG: M17 family metallopeptidase [Paracoccaceae bacterium]